MQPKYLQELIKNLQEVHKCPSCETNYFFDDIRFLAEMDAYVFVQLSCHNCSLPVLSTVPINGRADRSGTDLRHTEEAKFASKGSITASEIAEFHRLIKSPRLAFKRK